MTAESQLWDRIKETYNSKTGDRYVSGRLPLGALKREDISWTARGRSEEMDTSYEVDATEHVPYGWVAKHLNMQHTLSAVVTKCVSAWEDHGSLKTMFDVRMVAGELVGLNAVVLEANDCEADRVAGPKIWTPHHDKPALTPQEAARDLELVFAEAHFVA